MNFNVIVMHNDELNTIIDATIANKAQNAAIKRLVNASCDTLMNRIATGWLDEIVAVPTDSASRFPSNDMCPDQPAVSKHDPQAPKQYSSAEQSFTVNP